MNDNELKWQTRDEMPTPTNPLQRMRETKPQNSTETALFYTACYGFVLCLCNY